MSSLILESLKYNCFIPFPDKKFQMRGENDFDSIMKLTSNKTILDFKNSSYTTWQFSGLDNELFFSANSKKIENWYYNTHSVNYTLNSFGYRTKNFDEIDWSNSIVMFGCSFVFGVGVDDHHTIPFLLEQEINIPVINMGVGASSSMFHVHNASILRNNYPSPKAIILGIPKLSRHFYYHFDDIFHVGDWNDNNQYDQNKIDSIIRNITSILTLESIWKNKVPFIEYSIFEKDYNLLQDILPNKNRFFMDIEYYRKSPDKMGRDLVHPGFVKNLKIAKELSKNLKSYQII